MSDAFTRAAAALVADANMGLDAVYLPASGPSIPCRIVLSRPLDMMAPGGISSAMLASLPVAVVPSPARGDELRVPSLPRPGNCFTVQEVTTDPMRAMHDLTLAAT